MLAVGGYLVYQNWPAISSALNLPAMGTAAAGTMCKFPDGSTIAMPAGNQCPYDANHGGQSTPCYPSTFVGTLPAGGVHC